jgi:hypothetical protein
VTPMRDEAKTTHARCVSGSNGTQSGQDERTVGRPRVKEKTIPGHMSVAIALSGLFARSCSAGEYCSEDNYSSARSCSFSSMERCKAVISGLRAKPMSSGENNGLPTGLSSIVGKTMGIYRITPEGRSAGLAGDPPLLARADASRLSAMSVSSM